MALLPACGERSATPMGLFLHQAGDWRDCSRIGVRHQKQRTKALPGASRGQMGHLGGSGRMSHRTEPQLKCSMPLGLIAERE